MLSKINGLLLIVLILLVSSCSQDPDLTSNQSIDPNFCTRGKNKHKQSGQVTKLPFTTSYNYPAISPCGIIVNTLYAGQTNDVGSVTVQNDNEFIYITLELSDNDYYMKEAHVFIGSLDNVPMAGPGNPKVGQFPLKKENLPAYTKTITFKVSLDDLTETDFIVSAHASIYKMKSGFVQQGSSESAWGDGERFVYKGNWATYFYYTIGDCNGTSPCLITPKYYKLLSGTTEIGTLRLVNDNYNLQADFYFNAPYDNYTVAQFSLYIGTLDAMPKQNNSTYPQASLFPGQITTGANTLYIFDPSTNVFTISKSILPAMPQDGYLVTAYFQLEENSITKASGWIEGTLFNPSDPNYGAYSHYMWQSCK